jgi:hypothetical protein
MRPDKELCKVISIISAISAISAISTIKNHSVVMFPERATLVITHCVSTIKMQVSLL